jgi:hypothetical protein
MKNSVSILIIILALGIITTNAYSGADPYLRNPVIVPTGSETFNVPSDVPDTTSASYGIPNTLVKNDFNVFNTPGNMFRYGTAYAEIWNNMPWGGFTLKGPFGLKTAIFINRPYNGKTTWYQSNTSSYFPNLFPNDLTGVFIPVVPTGNMAVLNPKNYFDIMVGAKLGDVGGLGVKFTLCMDSDNKGYHSDTTPTNRGSDGTMSNSRFTADHRLTVGLSFNQFLFFSGLDVSADIGFQSFDNKYTETFRTNKQNAKLEAKSVPGANMSFLLRPMFKITEDDSLIMLFNVSTYDVSSENTVQVDTTGNGTYTNKGFDQNTSISISDKDTAFAAALALHTKPADKLKIIYSTGFNTDTRTRKVTSTAFGTNYGTTQSVITKMSIPLAFSIEFEMAEWSKLRFGISQDIYNYKDTAGDNTVPHSREETSSIFDRYSLGQSIVTLGVGFLPVKNLEIDLALSAYAFDLTAFIGRGSIRFHY